MIPVCFQIPEDQFISVLVGGQVSDQLAVYQGSVRIQTAAGHLHSSIPPDDPNRHRFIRYCLIRHLVHHWPQRRKCAPDQAVRAVYRGTQAIFMPGCQMADYLVKHRHLRRCPSQAMTLIDDYHIPSHPVLAQIQPAERLHRSKCHSAANLHFPGCDPSQVLPGKVLRRPLIGLGEKILGVRDPQGPTLQGRGKSNPHLGFSTSAWTLQDSAAGMLHHFHRRDLILVQRDSSGIFYPTVVRQIHLDGVLGSQKPPDVFSHPRGNHQFFSLDSVQPEVFGGVPGPQPPSLPVGIFRIGEDQISFTPTFQRLTGIPDPDLTADRYLHLVLLLSACRKWSASIPGSFRMPCSGKRSAVSPPSFLVQSTSGMVPCRYDCC